MTKLFAWCDSPLAPTGFGRSANHVLNALHETGEFEIVQLAINQDPALIQEIPWRVYMPLDRTNDAYGLQMLPELLQREQPDLMWSTFDPEVPWKYAVPGASMGGQQVSALDFILQLRGINPGFRAMTWVPVDGGPLSNFELSVLGLGNQFDYVATMSPHVHGLVEWTLRLRGAQPDPEAIRQRLAVIPHGVDLARYSIPTTRERRDAKEALGVDPDAYLVVQVERNQQRKQNYLALEVMERLLTRQPKQRGKVLLWQHMLRNEETAGCQLGFDLPELCWRYGLEAGKDVRWPDGFVPEEEMPRVYRAADAFLSTSTGEGFQYPTWEALATGVPLVVPDNSSRHAWFKDAPNVRLFECIDRVLVMRGGYQRRMAMPQPTKAADQLGWLMQKPPTPAKRRDGRAFVEKHARVEDVQAKWVEVVRGQREELHRARKGMGVVVPEDLKDEYTVSMMHGPGLGDVVLAAPALVALRRRLHEEGKRLHLRVPATHLMVARMLDCADALETRESGGAGPLVEVDYLYRDGHKQGWGDPNVHRTDVVARYLGVEPSEVGPMVTQVDPQIIETARSQFVSAFGAEPTTCVGIALESANPHRALPPAYIPQLIDGIKAMGLTPVVLGRTPLGLRTVGAADLTGQTDVPYLVALIEQLAAVVVVDSATLHFAGMVGTPMVACFTLFAPETRLRYYAGPVEIVTAKGPIDGEEFPAGPKTKVAPGAWAATIKPGEILAALRRLLGVEGGAVKITRPGEK